MRAEYIVALLVVLIETVLVCAKLAHRLSWSWWLISLPAILFVIVFIVTLYIAGRANKRDLDAEIRRQYQKNADMQRGDDCE